jgi:uncharacterized membrane protein YvbJ
MMPECKKCGYEIEEDEFVYCQSCFELLLGEIDRLKKENKRLEDERRELRNKVELIELGLEGRKWEKKRRLH